MTATQEQRITDLESKTFRVEQRLDRLAGATEHLMGAVGEPSQGQRALAFDVTEIRRELGEVRGAVSRIEREHGEQLREQGEQLRGHGEMLRGHGELLRGHGELLRAILERLGNR